MPVLAVCTEWNWILKEYHFASNTNLGQRECFASERHFVLLQRALPSFSLFLSLRERRWGGDFPSMHYSSSVTDTNWAAATAEGLPVTVCVPASNQNRACWHTHTHTHSQTHSTARWQTRESMPILFVHNPKSTYRSLDNPQRVCRDSYRHTTDMGTNLHKSMHLVHLVLKHMKV